MPPFMGAGMGTGIRDVANLSWKINLVLKNIAKSEILKTYQKERYPHAKWTIAQTVSIGEIIEGFCAAEEGKKFIPERKDMMLNFLTYLQAYLLTLKTELLVILFHNQLCILIIKK